jgi:hypothetical protein
MKLGAYAQAYTVARQAVAASKAHGPGARVARSTGLHRGSLTKRDPADLLKTVRLSARRAFRLLWYRAPTWLRALSSGQTPAKAASAAERGPAGPVPLSASLGDARLGPGRFDEARKRLVYPLNSFLPRHVTQGFCAVCGSTRPG